MTVAEVLNEPDPWGLISSQAKHTLIKAERETKREIERLQTELQILEEQLGNLQSRMSGGMAVVARPRPPVPGRAKRLASRASKLGLHAAVLEVKEEKEEEEEEEEVWLEKLKEPPTAQEFLFLGGGKRFASHANKQERHAVVLEGRGDRKGEEKEAAWLEKLKELPTVQELLAPVVREQLKGVAEHSRQPRLGETLRLRYQRGGTVETTYMRSDLGNGSVKSVGDLVVETGFDEEYLYGGEVTMAAVAQRVKQGVIHVWRKGTGRLPQDGINEKLVCITEANC